MKIICSYCGTSTKAALCLPLTIETGTIIREYESENEGEKTCISCLLILLLEQAGEI